MDRLRYKLILLHDKFRDGDLLELPCRKDRGDFIHQCSRQAVLPLAAGNLLSRIIGKRRRNNRFHLKVEQFEFGARLLRIQFKRKAESDDSVLLGQIRRDILEQERIVLDLGGGQLLPLNRFHGAFRIGRAPRFFFVHIVPQDEKRDKNQSDDNKHCEYDLEQLAFEQL